MKFITPPAGILLSTNGERFVLGSWNMLRSKGPNSRVASGDLLERALRELETLREWITFHSPVGLESNLARASIRIRADCYIGQHV